MNRYNLVAIEPNIEILESYKKSFTLNFQGYRDKKTFGSAHNNYTFETGFIIHKAPLILIMETAFAENIDENLPDAPHINDYQTHVIEKLSTKTISKKCITQGLGITLAKEIREGKYRYIPINNPIIFTTWLDKNAANKELLTIPNTWYIQKETTIIDDKASVNIEALHDNIEIIIQDILRR